MWRYLGPALGALEGEVPSSVSALLGLASEPGPTVLVLLDDIHVVDGLESEAALSDIAARCPSRLRLVMASRVSLGLDLSRLRVSGELLEIAQDDLRFRTWEVEELFRDVYGEPLVPEDVAALAQRTAGWAAYLQLFFLATARKPLAERRRVLNTLGIPAVLQAAQMIVAGQARVVLIAAGGAGLATLARRGRSSPAPARAIRFQLAPLV